jgi:hypothetical protein
MLVCFPWINTLEQTPATADGALLRNSKRSSARNNLTPGNTYLFGERENRKIVLILSSSRGRGGQTTTPSPCKALSSHLTIGSRDHSKDGVPRSSRSR